MCDLIYRQNAIDAMCLACGHDCDKSKFVYNAPQDEQVIMCPEHYALSTLPSAEQPEKLTDSEQRIFLAAISREKIVCAEVDRSIIPRETYEDSLVYICKEIERKVKGALWT